MQQLPGIPDDSTRADVDVLEVDEFLQKKKHIYNLNNFLL